MHRGVDVAGTFPVTSAGDGVVHSKGYNAKGGGHWVKVDHGSGIYTVYYHGHRETELIKGQRVYAGDPIYTSGSTGLSTGPHLHWEVRKGLGAPAWGTDVDPMPYLGGEGAGPGSGELALTGRMDKATQRKWQEALKARYGYRGRVDGALGHLSWMAIQESLKPHGYRGKVDGIPGRLTYGALQRKLGRPETGRLNGEDIKALQTMLNAGSY